MEEAIRGDFALLKAKYADEDGNLVFYKSANNFNQDIAVKNTYNNRAFLLQFDPSGSAITLQRT